MTVAPERCRGSIQQPVHTRALIIGTGFSGLGMAIALQQQGVDFLILEKADDVGGTWRDNTYPGCACDIPSHLYSFSFEPKPTGATVLVRSRRSGTTSRASPTSTACAATSGSTRSSTARTGTTTSTRWHVFTDDGQEYVAQFLDLRGRRAAHPADPRHRRASTNSPGAAFHSAQWDHGVDLTGKRVAVIGTGASAIQFVPEIVERRRRTAALPAHPAVGGAAAQQAVPGLGRRRMFTHVPGAAARGAQRHLLVPRGPRLRA